MSFWQAEFVVTHMSESLFQGEGPWQLTIGPEQSQAFRELVFQHFNAMVSHLFACMVMFLIGQVSLADDLAGVVRF